MIRLSSLTVLVVLLLGTPAGAAVSTNQSGWLWGTPEPQGHTLPALELQGTTGYAAGGFGTLLRTNDGGTSWGTVRTGLSLDFSLMDVIDADSIVVASFCAARRTDDGGETFRRLPYTSNERGCARRLLGVSFPTADVGYLLLDDGGLLRTTDGGRSFSPRSVPGGGGGFVTGVMFRNANDGLAVTTGGDIFKTTNGGASWTREFDGERELNGVLFTAARAVAVGGGGTFVVSPDGGDTWARPAAEPGAPPPPNADFSNVRCASATLCLIDSRPGTVYRTIDGGRTFEDTGVTNSLALDFASATRAVTVGFGGETHLSSDGGASFSHVGARLETGTLTAVRATSTSIAHAIGESGALARTIDGGESWDNIGVPTGNSLKDVWFPTSSVGYALDFSGALFRTENGGDSWSILDTGVDRAASGVFAPDASTVYLIGSRGVLRSNDGGETFERHRHRVIRNRTLVEADQAGSAVVFYGPRVIALSTNDGKTWRHLTRPTRAEISHVDFVSSRAGYVLETSGRVQFTRNRGRSWKELIGVGYKNGRRLAFGNRRNGWLDVGSTHPNVLRTTDGGKSWTPQILAGQQVMGIAAAGSQTGFATLSNPPATILFTQGGGDSGAESTLRLRAPDSRVPRGRKIEIRGRLSPAEGGEDVEVRVRRLTGRRWREIDVTPRRNGRFVIERRIRRAMVFVGQWEGDADSDGDGTRPLIVRVGG